MKIRRMLAAFFVLALATPLFAGPAPKGWRLLKKGTDGVPIAKGEEGGARRAPWIETASDNKTLAEIWKREVPGKPGPVDFGSETVIFLLLGVQSTGGYAIEPIAVDPPAEGLVRVHARLVQPMTEEAAIDVLTAPYAVIAVRATKVAKIEWVDADGRLLATRIVE